MSMLPITVPAWLILSTWQPTCWNGYGSSETCHFPKTDDGNYRVDQKHSNCFLVSVRFFLFFTSTPFRQPSKSSIFFAQEMDGKKINRDFIKGGRGGSPFYEVVSQKIFFFTIDGFP